MLPGQSLKVQVWYLVTFWCRRAGVFSVISVPEWVVELLEGQIGHFLQQALLETWVDCHIFSER